MASVYSRSALMQLSTISSGSLSPNLWRRLIEHDISRKIPTRRDCHSGRKMRSNCCPCSVLIENVVPILLPVSLQITRWFKKGKLQTNKNHIICIIVFRVNWIFKLTPRELAIQTAIQFHWCRLGSVLILQEYARENFDTSRILSLLIVCVNRVVSLVLVCYLQIPCLLRPRLMECDQSSLNLNPT